MLFIRHVWFGLAMAAGISFAAQTNSPQNLAELQSRLADHVSSQKFKAGTFGVKIVSAATGKVVFENDADELLSPASNSKLYTVALALDQLGQDYRIRTSLYAHGQAKDGKLPGDLIVFGRGDPTINPRIRGSLDSALEPFARALTNAGIHTIEGDLVADESFIRGPEYGSGWTWDDAEYYYGAEISALTINDNLVELKIKPGAAAGQSCSLELVPYTSQFVLSNRTATVEAGGARSIRVVRQPNSNVLFVMGKMPLDDKGAVEDVTLHDPALFFVECLKETLSRRGIKVLGNLRVIDWLDREVEPIKFKDLTELAAIESLPMKDIAREVQKPSQNLYTDLLLAHVGERTRTGQTSSSDTSEDLGIRELRKFLSGFGIKRSEVQFEEGSGLSRNNLTTANATTTLLMHMSKHPAATAYWEALPVAGVDGTLRNRMKNTPAAKNVRAKTGTLRWAYSLSGDLRTASGERLIFSIMLNRYYNQSSEISTREEVDFIPVLLSGYTGKIDE